VTTASATAAPDRPLLEVKGVTKRFGAVEALTDVDFEVHAGEVVAED
jgi:D-xylose transport system ATP-binding protein